MLAPRLLPIWLSQERACSIGRPLLLKGMKKNNEGRVPLSVLAGAGREPPLGETTMKFRNEPAPSFPFLKARLVFHFQISRLDGRNKKCRRVVERERVSICRSCYLIESRLYFGIAIPARTIMHWHSCKNVLQGLRDIVQAIKPRIRSRLNGAARSAPSRSK
jgi:hypothetical protein